MEKARVKPTEAGKLQTDTALKHTAVAHLGVPTNQPVEKLAGKLVPNTMEYVDSQVTRTTGFGA